MKIINERPPIYEAVLMAGLRFNPERTFFAYHDAIYNPAGIEISEDVKAHEAVHLAQQEEAGGAEIWWSRYLSEPLFRIDQEADAYATQYAFICSFVGDRNQRVRILLDLARKLAGPMYGSMITVSAAQKMIKDRLI